MDKEQALLEFEANYRKSKIDGKVATYDTILTKEDLDRVIKKVNSEEPSLYNCQFCASALKYGQKCNCAIKQKEAERIRKFEEGYQSTTEENQMIREFSTGAIRDTDQELELAWAGGFFDGEGSTCCSVNNGKPHTRIALSIGQKNEDTGQPAETLQRFKKAVGLGKIYKKSCRGKDINQSQWSVCKRIDVFDTMLKLWPYISTTKRKQMRKALHLFLGDF